ncbi:sulfatase-like hydrolase/transferase [Leptospira sp. 201903070]|uniref:Sulfatase-like hydrolase/transferase n=1 Tax=Leptospira ainlahdjerensis TaxID=2810033 RepID=A0ABS2U9U1_9LEPT|nr:sulfatase-like hydrolase/transferase [Leptospira ainlahdjerensis]MBM9577126.1 sulfatase-like hydrolase/transferase [Leptospira ainlahdjerensis]
MNLEQIQIILKDASLRRYFRFFTIGMGVSLLTLILNSSFQIMGVDLSEFQSLFLSFLPLFLKDYAGTLVASGVLFSAIALVLFGAGGPEDQNLISPKKEIIVFSVFVFLLWIHSVILYPQLYGEFFFDRFSFLRPFLFFLTDRLSPLVPQVAAFVLLVGFVGWRIFSFAIKKEWRLLSFFTLFCLFLFCFHLLGSVLGIWIVSSVYLLSAVFQNSKGSKFVWLGVLLVTLGISWSGKDSKIKTKTYVSKSLPNILILSADSLRYDKMGFSQKKENFTPNIDLLAKDSILFQDHHTTIPRTFPAWADLLTGQPSFVHGIQDMFPDAKDRSGMTRISSRTLPRILSELGYETNVVSSFAGDIFPRADWGFQSVKAPIFHAGTLTAQRILESQIFLLPILTGSIPGAGEYFSSLKGLPSLGDDSKILPDLLPGLKKREVPFFTVFFSSVTHFPFSPPFPYYQKFTNPEYYGKFKYFKFVDPSDSSAPSREDREQINGLFQAAIASFDGSVGEIVAKLKEEGIYDSTLIVLTSDHGESLFEADHSHGHGEHLRGEGVTHIPLLIKFPSNAGGGKTFSGISSSLDLFPTLLQFVLERIGDSPEKNTIRSEIQNRPGRDLSFAFQSSSWKDDRSVYGETGIWFSDRGDHFFQKQRIFYPNILQLHSIETGDLPFISIGDSYAKESIIVSKHRMFQSAKRKLIYIPSEDGVLWACYDRIRDPWNTNSLPISQCSSLKESLYSFLLSSGKFKKAGEYLLPSSN